MKKRRVKGEKDCYQKSAVVALKPVGELSRELMERGYYILTGRKPQASNPGGGVVPTRGG